jgi:hypothetical protein
MYFFQNLQFAEALTSRVEKLYASSWINQYYNVTVNHENGIVFFYDVLIKQIMNSYRFDILVYIPEICKPYFDTAENWMKVGRLNLVKTDLISNVPTGLRTQSIPATKSLYYTAPFFLKLNQSCNVISNYLEFKGFFKPNVDKCILAMISYNEFEETFVADFLPTIRLSFLQTLSLNKNLEFILIDSNNKQVTIEDKSQLFISITIAS